VTEFWEIDPNHTFMDINFNCISHYHMNSIKLSRFVGTSKLKLSKKSKKCCWNISVLYKIPLDTPNVTGFTFFTHKIFELWNVIVLQWLHM